MMAKGNKPGLLDGCNLTCQGGDVLISESFTVSFKADKDKVDVVKPGGDDAAFSLTVIKSPSGAGKSTFLNQVNAYINGDTASQATKFELRPTHRKVAVGFIPQNPPMVNHWCVRSILPVNTCFDKCFFDDPADDFTDRHMGDFSGGQGLKLYAWSALERLALCEAKSVFLLLDETFDGIGAEEAVSRIAKMKTRWIDTFESLRSLHVLLITHLAQSAFSGATNLSLAVDKDETDCLTVVLKNGTGINDD